MTEHLVGLVFLSRVVGLEVCRPSGHRVCGRLLRGDTSLIFSRD